MKQRKLLSLFLAIVMALSLAVSASAVEETPAALPLLEDAAGSIVILHTNDVHGAIDSYAKVAALKDAYEEAGAYVLLVDAGDFIQGEPTVSVSEGATAVELMNMVGYDLAAPGNHEFDYGYENLKALSEKAEFPILAANVQYEGKPAFGTTKVFTATDGTKIGFFGLDTPETATKAHPAKIKGVTFLAGDELFQCAQSQVDALKKEGADIIVCLGHLGIDEESVGNRSIDLLEKVTGIDLFIDGHSHSTMDDINAATDNTSKVKDTWLVSTGTKLANVGMVMVKDGTFRINPIATETLTASDEAVAARAQEIAAEIEKEYGAVFAKTEVDLNGERDPGNRTQETNLGNLITDALVWGAKQAGTEVDAAVTNGGGIRASIAKGDITKKDVNTVLPFGNTLSIVEVTGAELLEALEASTYCTPTAIGGFPQVSGIVFSVDTSAAFDQGEMYTGSTYYGPKTIARVTIDTVGGKDFSLTDTYTIATNDFMASGGDTYYAFKTATVNYDLGVAMDEVVMNYITDELKGVVTAEKYGSTENRISVKYVGVDGKAWYAEAAKYVMDEGLMTSTGKGFDPTATVTRATVYQTLYNMEGKPAVEKAVVTDVEGKWYTDCINWAASIGLFEGTEFGADAVITRAGIASIIADYAAYKEITVDVSGMAMKEAPDYESIPADALEGMTFCYYAGIMTGDQAGNLKPAGELTRAEFAQVLSNLLPYTVADLTVKVTEVSKYGNLTFDLTPAAFAEAGYKVGDIVTLTVGETTVEAPVGTGYSNVDQGSAIVVLLPDAEYVAAAVNMGSLAEKLSAQKDTEVTLSMSVPDGYLDEYNFRNIDAQRTNDRADYASDEVFANFRPIVMGDIAEGVLYRSSSPVNPELGRNTYADALMKAAGVRTVINLADSEEAMKAYEGYKDSYYATVKVAALNMGVDTFADAFKAQMKTGVEFMLANEGPYLFHCTEGKDRAGFMAILLESLMGGTVDQIKADYMTSYVNYYHVEEGSEQYNRIAESNVLATLRKLAGLEAGADLTGADLKKAAADYLTSCGLTAKQISDLQTLLSTPITAEKAA